MRIRVTKRADANIEQAAIWWEQNRPLSPGALDEELAEAFTLLISQPAIGAPALNAKTRGVRRVHRNRPDKRQHMKPRVTLITLGVDDLQKSLACYRDGLGFATQGIVGAQFAKIVKAAHDTFWGGYAGYFQDPDDHLWEVAWNPQWTEAA